MRLAAVALVVVLGAAPAQAVEPVSNPLIAEGLRHLDNLRYGEARAALKKALATGGNTRPDMVTLYAHLGIACAADGDQIAALDAFDHLLALEPAWELPQDSSPKLRMPFVAARERAAGRKPVSLVHLPPHAVVGEPVYLTVEIGADPLKQLARFVTLFRFEGDAEWQRMRQNADPHTEFQLPRAFLVQGKAGSKLEYVVEGTDASNNVLVTAGRRLEPLSVVMQAPSSAVATEPALPVASEPAAEAAPEVATAAHGPGLVEYARPAAIGVGIATGAVFIAGLVAGVASSQARSELEEAQGEPRNSLGAVSSITRARALELQATANSRAHLANGLFLGAAVGLVATTGLAYWSLMPGDAEPVAALSVGPGGLSVRLRY